MHITINSSDFTTLLEAATLGIAKAEGFKADFVVAVWRETFERLNNTPLEDGRTQEERDQSARDTFADDCARYGAD